MPRRFVSVGDDLTLPDDVIVADGNLPARLSDGELSATFAPASGSANYASTASLVAKQDKADAVPKWKPNTAYTLGQQVISPTNDVVAAKAAFTSGGTFDAANWNTSTTVTAQVAAAIASDSTPATAAAAAVNQKLAEAGVVSGGYDLIDSTVFGALTDSAGNFSPFVWTPTGRLHSHSASIIGEDAAGLSTIVAPGYHTIAIDDAGNIVYSISDKGVWTIPGFTPAATTQTAAAAASPVYLPSLSGGDVYVQNLTDGKRVKITTGKTISDTPTMRGSAVVFTADGVLSWAPGDGGTVYPMAADATKLATWGSSTMQFAAQVFTNIANEHGAVAYNFGVGGTSAEHILARYGSRPALADAFTIPASGGVTITLQNVPVSTAAFTYDVTIAGIAGTITKSGTTVTFTRTASGTATAVTAGTPLISVPGAAHRGDIILLNIGKNNLTGVGGTTDVDTLFQWTKDAYNYATALTKNVLVMGHYVDTDTPATGYVRTLIQNYNAKLAAEFGSRYFNMSAMVTSPDVWTITGLTPTTDDLAQQASGNKPWSISVDTMHLNAKGNDLLQNKVTSALTGLGWIN